MNNFAERLKNARKKIGVGQAFLAEKINISAITLSRYENGHREPKTEDLSKLATALGTSVAYLMGETDDSEPRHLKKSIPEVTTAMEDNAMGIFHEDTLDLTAAGNIVFERGEGSNKTRIVLPPTAQTYAFLREQMDYEDSPRIMEPQEGGVIEESA